MLGVMLGVMSASDRSADRSAQLVGQCLFGAVEQDLPATGRQRERGVLRLGVEQQQQRPVASPRGTDEGAEHPRFGLGPIPVAERLAAAAQPAQVGSAARVGQPGVPGRPHRQPLAPQRRQPCREVGQPRVGT